MRIIFGTALLLVVVYSAALHFAGLSSAVRSQSQWQDNLAILERFDAATTDIDSVYVGSSLTRRLPIDTLNRCAFNLALDGDSALTGLAAIRSRTQPLRQVLVEINVPQRPEDPEMLSESSRHVAYRLPIFLTENIPINRLLSFASEGRRLHPRPAVRDAAFEGALRLQQQSYSKPIDPDELKRRMDRFRALVSALESLRTKVVFFELPVDSSLEETPRARQVRAAFAATFPSNALVRFRTPVDLGEIHTLDGVHLDPDSAGRVTAYMQERFPAHCGGLPGPAGKG